MRGDRMVLSREEILSAIYHCVKCKLCSIACFHPEEEWLPLCPSGQFYGYQAFYAPGSVEIRLPELFEAMRRVLVAEGWALDAHGEVDRKRYSNKYQDADVLYFIGCTARYRVPEIADAMIGIFDKLGIRYRVMEEEWCCGSGGGVKS